MKSDDKRFLKQVLDKIKAFKTANHCASHINPIDDEVTTQFQSILDKISDDAFDIFRFKKNLMKLWKEMLEKSIICLRFFDKREPFQEHEDKVPYAYGVEKLYDYFLKYNNFEKMLYGGSEYYRDHMVHVFRVWIIGTDMLLREKAKFLNSIKISDEFDINGYEKLSIWTIIALTHDLGYPLEKALQIIDKTKDMMKCFIQNPVLNLDLSFSGVQNTMNDFVLRFMSSKMWKVKNIDDSNLEYDKKDKDLKFYAARLQPKFYFKFQKSLEQNKHGILSALLLYKMLLYFLESDFSTNEDYAFEKEEARQFYMRREILRAISSHTCQDIYQLHLYSFSLLLIIADDAQEWGRKQISELYVKKATEYSFSGIKLNQQEGAKTKCTLNEKYVIEESEQLEQIFKQFIRISLNYNDWFRDGQDTGKRDFDFCKSTQIELKVGDVDKDIILDLNISSNNASTISIQYNKDECADLDIENILKKYFGDKIKYNSENTAQTRQFATCIVGDVKRFKEFKEFEKLICD